MFFQSLQSKKASAGSADRTSSDEVVIGLHMLRAAHKLCDLSLCTAVLTYQRMARL
jgi:hypothetical protein